MSLDGHLSRPSVTGRLKRPTRKQTGRLMLPVWPCFEWGLHVYFCCTVPEVAFAGRYPAPCPLKPGLSSPASLRTAAATICLTQNLFILAYIYFDVQTCVYIFFVTAFTDNVHMDAHSYENTTEKTNTTTRSDSFPR